MKSEFLKINQYLSICGKIVCLPRRKSHIPRLCVAKSRLQSSRNVRHFLLDIDQTSIKISRSTDQLVVLKGTIMGDDENACVRNIVKEIMRECHPKKILVNKNFLTYLTKLLLIDPNWGIDDDFFNQREHVQHFVKYVTDDLLTAQDKPNLVTIKIQFYFSCNLVHMDYIIELNRRDLKNRVASLKEDIYIMTDISYKEAMDVLLRKITYYITLITGLGNPTKPKVFEEASMALRSILDEDELIEFVESPKNIKYQRLEQFSKVVAGIRLFNKDCEKGGEGIENLPDLLTRAIEVIKSGTEFTLLLIMEKVNILTTIVDKCYILKATYMGYQMTLEIPDEVSKYVHSVDIEYMKDLLIFFRQYELLIRRIIDDLEYITTKTDTIYAGMEKLLKRIHDTVYMRIAIPVDTVFPLFEQLYDIWSHLQDQVLLLSQYSQIMTNLETYAKQTHYDHYMIDKIVGQTGSMSDAERLMATSHFKLTSVNKSIEVYTIDSIQNADSLEFEYLGFCCWKLVETNGALIPGNPNMGIVRYQNKNYVFSAIAGFQAFSADPELYLNRVLALARKKPQLINLFHVQKDLERVFTVPKLVQSQEEIRLCENKSVQVTDHFLDTNMDSKHDWNIWDLKRDALTMANILSYKTVSTQTDKGGSKNSMRTQTFPNKEVEVQTTRDNYTNVPKPSTFIYGLRGRKDDKQLIVHLTRPIKE